MPKQGRRLGLGGMKCFCQELFFGFLIHFLLLQMRIKLRKIWDQKIWKVNNEEEEIVQRIYRESFRVCKLRYTVRWTFNIKASFESRWWRFVPTARKRFQILTILKEIQKQELWENVEKLWLLQHVKIVDTAISKQDKVNILDWKKKDLISIWTKSSQRKEKVEKDWFFVHVKIIETFCEQEKAKVLRFNFGLNKFFPNFP